MEPVSKCAKCGQSNLVRGSFPRTPLTFYADDSPAFTLTDESVTVEAVLCLDCGSVEFVGRSEQVSRLRSKLATRQA